MITWRRRGNRTLLLLYQYLRRSSSSYPKRTPVHKKLGPLLLYTYSQELLFVATVWYMLLRLVNTVFDYFNEVQESFSPSELEHGICIDLQLAQSNSLPILQIVLPTVVAAKHHHQNHHHPQVTTTPLFWTSYQSACHNLFDPPQRLEMDEGDSNTFILIMTSSTANNIDGSLK